jgi:hypothetical protein
MPTPQFHRTFTRRRRRRGAALSSPPAGRRTNVVDPAVVEPEREAAAEEETRSDASCALLQPTGTDPSDREAEDEVPALLTRRPRRR